MDAYHPESSNLRMTRVMKIKLKEPEQVEKQEVVTWSEDIWGMFVDKSKYKNDDTLSSHSKMMAYIHKLVASDLVNPKEQTKSVA